MRLYAFWRYDLFPYILGGEVVSMTDAGLVKIKEYGGSAFRPVLILPYDAGIEIHEKLRLLDDRYRKALRELNAGFLREAQELVPGVKLP